MTETEIERERCLAITRAQESDALPVESQRLLCHIINQISGGEPSDLSFSQSLRTYERQRAVDIVRNEQSREKDNGVKALLQRIITRIKLDRSR